MALDAVDGEAVRLTVRGKVLVVVEMLLLHCLLVLVSAKHADDMPLLL